MSRVLLGTDLETGQQIWIDDLARQSGLYLLGRPGMGKSATAVNIALQDIANDHGIFFIDPHGDAVVDLARRLKPEKLSKTFLFDPEDDTRSFGINLLACDNVESLRERTATYTRAYNVFYKLWEDQFGPWLQLILQNVLWAFIENQDYRLVDVPLFLNPRNTAFREHIIDNIKYNQAVADFWRYEFFQRREQDQQERVDAALTRINTLLTHPYVRHIIGQRRHLGIEQAVSETFIILFRLSANLAPDIKKFIGTMLISEILHGVRARREGARDQSCLFIDEFANFASNDDMATMVTEGRKFGLASTYMHVERFGQLGDNQKLMGATQATVNKIAFQLTVKDAEELAPEFAKTVEPTEPRIEPVFIFSPHPIEDIWDKGHPHEDIMWLRGRYFWLVQLLRSEPNNKHFVFEPSRTDPKYRSTNPLKFRMQDFTDWDYYRSSADMVRKGISLWNQYLLDWMYGKYDPNKIITDEQVEIVTNIIECLSGVLGFLPMMQPYIPNDKRERLLYLINEKSKREFVQGRQNKIQTIRDQLQQLKEYGPSLFATPKLTKITEFDKANGILKSIYYEGERLTYEGIYRYDYEALDELVRRKKALWEQLITVEQSQPPEYTSISAPSSSAEEAKKIQSIAVQAGMPMHEVEEFIEWELNPFTTEEKEGLHKYIKFAARIANDVMKREDEDNATKIYWNENPKAIDPFFVASKKRRNITVSPSNIQNIRSNWQHHELFTFINLVNGDTPRILVKNPVKISSGNYTETLRVERPQHDLVTDMVLELSRLPRFHAAAKIVQQENDRQTVQTHKIQTNPLPKIENSQGEIEAIDNAHHSCVERNEIEEEIRTRQSRWQDGGQSPPDTRARR